MSIEYISDGSRFLLSYSELQADFERYSTMSDEEFLSQLPRILHFACVVSYLKELNILATLGDKGIVHELIHLLDKTYVGTTLEYELPKIREQFKQFLALV